MLVGIVVARTMRRLPSAEREKGGLRITPVAGRLADVAKSSSANLDFSTSSRYWCLTWEVSGTAEGSRGTMWGTSGAARARRAIAQLGRTPSCGSSVRACHGWLSTWPRRHRSMMSERICQKIQQVAAAVKIVRDKRGKVFGEEDNETGAVQDDRATREHQSREGRIGEHETQTHASDDDRPGQSNEARH